MIFFSLFVCHRHECQAENVTRSSKVLPKVSELGSMEKCSNTKLYKLNGHGSSSFRFVLVCDIVKLISGVIYLFWHCRAA